MISITVVYEGKRGRMKGREFEISLDAEDYPLYTKHKWYVGVDGKYVMCKDKGKIIYFHREIIGAKKGEEVDHINRNSLDNRKENLRIVSHQQNIMNTKMRSNNTSGHKGVRFNKNSKKWEVYLMVNYKKKHFGTYSDFNLACKVYDEKVKEFFGIYVGDKVEDATFEKLWGLRK